MKPGYKTSEFWLTAVASILAATVPIAIAYGILSQDEAEMWMNLILAVAAIVVPVVITSSAKKYTETRSEAKMYERMMSSQDSGE